MSIVTVHVSPATPGVTANAATIKIDAELEEQIPAPDRG